jgi:hypothetical protein
MNGISSRPYLYRGRPFLATANAQIRGERDCPRRHQRRRPAPAAGSCPLPCCPNDSGDGLPCQECREALGPVLRVVPQGLGRAA